MVKRNRRWLESTYNHLYSEIDSDHCCYCGDIKECLDHVPALTWLGSLGTEYFATSGYQKLLVPSCEECNSLLGSIGLFDMDERKCYISGALKERYKSLLQLPAWGSEINDLDFILKQAIIDKQRLARFVKARIAYADCCYIQLSSKGFEPIEEEEEEEEEEIEVIIDAETEVSELAGVWKYLSDWCEEKLPGVSSRQARRWTEQGLIAPYRNRNGIIEVHEDAISSVPKEWVVKHLLEMVPYWHNRYRIVPYRGETSKDQSNSSIQS